MSAGAAVKFLKSAIFLSSLLRGIILVGPRCESEGQEALGARVHLISVFDMQLLHGVPGRLGRQPMANRLPQIVS